VALCPRRRRHLNAPERAEIDRCHDRRIWKRKLLTWLRYAGPPVTAAILGVAALALVDGLPVERTEVADWLGARPLWLSLPSLLVAAGLIAGVGAWVTRRLLRRSSLAYERCNRTKRYVHYGLFLALACLSVIGSALFVTGALALVPALTISQGERGALVPIFLVVRLVILIGFGATAWALLALILAGLELVTVEIQRLSEVVRRRPLVLALSRALRCTDPPPRWTPRHRCVEPLPVLPARKGESNSP
jgi:hypothetical protein